MTVLLPPAASQFHFFFYFLFLSQLHVTLQQTQELMVEEEVGSSLQGNCFNCCTVINAGQASFGEKNPF